MKKTIGIKLKDLLVLVGMAKSKSEAIRLIRQGAVRVWFNYNKIKKYETKTFDCVPRTKSV